jgi:D-alanine-D-alanine ligase
MAKQRMNIGVVLGGMSAEHEVSWQSARNVIHALDPEAYQPIPILIDKQGDWHLLETKEVFSDDLLAAPDPKPLPEGRKILLDRDAGALFLVRKDGGTRMHRLDVVFPAVHGPYGEDGTLQGLCKMYQVPFVGPGVLSSSVCMDKEVMKRILLERGIPVPRYVAYDNRAGSRPDLEQARRNLGLPLFVKPANLGSSVGVTKVGAIEDLGKALAHAWQFDDKAIVEEFIEGREIECSVLGNEDPIASVPGEIIPGSEHGFYSYDAKYRDPEGADLKIPADLPEDVTAKVQDLAVRSFVALLGEGMARVDFFVKQDGSVLVNELNTIPGFTNISMYPKLWEASGIPCRELVHRLIQLGIERFRREAAKSCDWDAPPPEGS